MTPGLGRQSLAVVAVVAVMLGALACSMENTTPGVSMPPDAQELSMEGSTPMIWGWLFTGIAAINGTEAVVLEIGVGPDAVSHLQQYLLHPGEHAYVGGWDIQVARIDPGPREVVIYVIPGPGAPPWWASRHPAPTSSSTPNRPAPT